MQNAPRFHSWGVVWTEAIPRSADGSCLNCAWMFQGTQLVATVENLKQIVGFEYGPTTVSGYHPSTTRDGPIGKLIVECPRGFEKFWFHWPILS